MAKEIRFLESWASPLIAVGLLQVLFGIGIVAAASFSIAVCEDYRFISWAVIPGSLLLCIGFATISGFKCTPLMLLGLGLINFIMIGAACAAMAAGGIGMACEKKQNGMDSDYCVNFAKLVRDEEKCRNAWKPRDDDKTNKAFGTHAAVLGMAVVELILCIAAAVISIKARSQLAKPYQDLVEPGIIVGSGTEGAVVVAGSSAAQPPPVAPAPAGGINISNVNTIGVTTTVTDGETTTTTTTGNEPQPEPPPPPPSRRGSSRSQGSKSSHSSRGSRSSRQSSSRGSSTRSSRSGSSRGEGRPSFSAQEPSSHSRSRSR